MAMDTSGRTVDRVPPRRHPRPPLAHGVAHRLSGRRRTDPLPPRLPPHRRPQPDPRQRPRARRHAPDRPQRPAPSSTATTSSTSRNCLRPETSWSPIWRSTRRRRAVGARTRPARAPRRPSASCDAPPHKARVRSPPAPARRRRPRGRRVAGHRPSGRGGSRPGHTRRADPRSRHTRRRGGTAAADGHARDGSSSATRGWASVRATSRSHGAPSRTSRTSSPGWRGQPLSASVITVITSGTRATRTRHPREAECGSGSFGPKAVKGGAKLDHRGGGKLDHPAVEWRG